MTPDKRGITVSVIFTRSFALASMERATKAFAATLLALITATGADVVHTLNWGDKFAASGLAALASVLFSVSSAGIGGTGPSLANEVISPPAVDPGPPAADGYSVIEMVVGVLLVLILVVLLLRVLG